MGPGALAVPGLMLEIGGGPCVLFPLAAGTPVACSLSQSLAVSYPALWPALWCDCTPSGPPCPGGWRWGGPSQPSVTCPSWHLAEVSSQLKGQAHFGPLLPRLQTVGRLALLKRPRSPHVAQGQGQHPGDRHMGERLSVTQCTPAVRTGSALLLSVIQGPRRACVLKPRLPGHRDADPVAGEGTGGYGWLQVSPVLTCLRPGLGHAATPGGGLAMQEAWHPGGQFACPRKSPLHRGMACCLEQV